MARKKHKIRTDSDFDWDIRVMYKEKSKGSNRRQTEGNLSINKRKQR